MQVLHFIYLQDLNILFYNYFIVKHIFFARKIQKMHDAEDKILKEREFSSKDAKKAFKKRRTKQRRKVLVVDFIINLGLLCVIKYTDFILSGVSSILSKFGMDWSKEFNFILPLGISFIHLCLLDIYLMFIGRDIEQKQIILNLPYSQCISLILCRDQLEDITS